MKKTKNKFAVAVLTTIIIFIGLCVGVLYMGELKNPKMRYFLGEWHYFGDDWEKGLSIEMRRLYCLSKTRGPYFYISTVCFNSFDYMCMIQGIMLSEGKLNPPPDPEYDGYITFMPLSKKRGNVLPKECQAFIVTPSGEVYKRDNPTSLPERFVRRTEAGGGSYNARATILLDYKDNPESWKPYGKINITEKGKASFEEKSVR